MNRDDFEAFFNKNEGRFILGIHNYCDRWCERCEFTSKCSVFQIDEERAKNRKSKDDFAEIVSENFQIVLEMMEDIIEEQDIDLENIDFEEIQKEKATLEHNAKNHPLADKSEQYLKAVNQWLETSRSWLETMEHDINKSQELGIATPNQITDFKNINEAIEIINWFHIQIHIKIMRALRHGPLDLDFEDLIQNDINGSAKVALIGIEQSQGAWGILLKTISEKEDGILALLILLQRIKTDLLKYFPNAMRFIRPGFDE